MVDQARIYQIAIAGLAVVAVVLVGLTIHYHLEDDSSVQAEDQLDPKSKKYFMNFYRRFFRTDEEQAAFAKRFQVFYTTGIKVYECSKSVDALTGQKVLTNETAAGVSPSRTRRDAPAVYNGCCKSQMVWTRPYTALNDKNEIVTVTQIPPHYQNFQSETCCSVKPCSINCTCKQGVMQVKAIVNTTDGYGVTNIIIPGCCQCVNYSN